MECTIFRVFLYVFPCSYLSLLLFIILLYTCFRCNQILNIFNYCEFNFFIFTTIFYGSFFFCNSKTYSYYSPLLTSFYCSLFLYILKMSNYHLFNKYTFPVKFSNITQNYESNIANTVIGLGVTFGATCQQFNYQSCINISITML